jgi:two-component sensor histidine kinase
VDVAHAVKDCLVAQAESVPLALVLNELVSNAVKHGGRFGNVSVCLHTITPALDQPTRVRIIVANSLDAAGASASTAPSQSVAPTRASSGLELVAALLPPVGAELQQRMEGQKFISTLELQFPAMTWKVS